MEVNVNAPINSHCDDGTLQCSDSNSLTTSGGVGSRIVYRLLRFHDDQEMFRVQQLHDLCFPIQYDSSFYVWMQSPHCVALIAAELEENQTGGAGYPIGFIVGKVKYIEGPIFTQPVMYISTFGVDPDFRTKGVGHELLERFVAMVTGPAFIATSPACEALRRSNDTSLRCILALMGHEKPNRIHQIWLHCLAEDSQVVRFYSKRRFVSVDRVSAYYNFGDSDHDGLVMCREEVPESWIQSGLRKREGRRAGNASTLWERLAGTTTHEALQSQDGLDVRQWTKPQVSSAAWCMLSYVFVIGIALVFLWRAFR